MSHYPVIEPDRDPLSNLEVRCETCGYLWPANTPVEELDYEYIDHIDSDRHRKAVEQRSLQEAP